MQQDIQELRDRILCLEDEVRELREMVFKLNRKKTKSKIGLKATTQESHSQTTVVAGKIGNLYMSDN
jgi:predicted  nucleic acid-binding Zn-ribbon protein